MTNLEIKNEIINSLDLPVRDPLWKHIYLNREFLELCDSKPFQNLSEVKQLGPTYLVYPGAVHTRASHSFGVFEIGKRVILKVLGDKNCPPLTIEGVKAFLCACLFHDTGHFPYTHSLKELPLIEHEEISQTIINEEPVFSIINKTIKTSPEMVGNIINTETQTECKETNFYRNILSGVLDPDKLDYLNRDAFFCGVPYGIQDTEFIIDRLTPNGWNGLGLYEDGILALENILFSKYSMYKSVYWHRQVRCATAMMKKAIITGLDNEIIKPEDLYRLNDSDFFSKFTSEDFILSDIFSKVRNRNFYSCVYETKILANADLMNLETRKKIENNIVKHFLNSTKIVDQVKVVIDIPEPIKFESDLVIFDKNHNEIDNDSIFDKNISKKFSDNLRTIRIFVDKEIKDIIKIKDLNEWNN